MKLTNLFAAALMAVTTTAASADTGLMTKLENIEWTAIEGTPMALSILWGDRDTGPYAMYLKMPGGFVVPEHAHTYAYEGITIQGDWQHNFAGDTKVLPVGSRVVQPGNAFHGDACVSEEECVLFIFQDGKGDAIFHSE
jgi:anti-sigma factor ChrR (cupin superfamily)